MTQTLTELIAKYDLQEVPSKGEPESKEGRFRHKHRLPPVERNGETDQ